MIRAEGYHLSVHNAQAAAPPRETMGMLYFTFAERARMSAIIAACNKKMLATCCQ